jgi:hypothetical protein
MVIMTGEYFQGSDSKSKKRADINRGALCDPDWIQTNDLLLRRQLLYSTELPGHKIYGWAQRYHFRAFRKSGKAPFFHYFHFLFSLRKSNELNGRKN